MFSLSVMILFKDNLGVAVRKNGSTYFKEKRISTKGDVRMLVKAVLMISIYLAPFIVILTVPVSGWFALLLTVVIGIGEAGIGMSVMHDATHSAFSTKAWVNSLFSYTMFLLSILEYHVN